MNDDLLSHLRATAFAAAAWATLPALPIRVEGDASSVPTSLSLPCGVAATPSP